MSRRAAPLVPVLSAAPLAALAACSLCETRGGRLVPITMDRPRGGNSIEQVCRLCYVRLTGIDPSRAGRTRREWR